MNKINVSNRKKNGVTEIKNSGSFFLFVAKEDVLKAKIVWVMELITTFILQ